MLHSDKTLILCIVDNDHIFLFSPLLFSLWLFLTAQVHNCSDFHDSFCSCASCHNFTASPFTVCYLRLLVTWGGQILLRDAKASFPMYITLHYIVAKHKPAQYTAHTFKHGWWMGWQWFIWTFPHLYLCVLIIITFTPGVDKRNHI